MNGGNYKKYVWQQTDWPKWVYDLFRLSRLLSEVNMERGRLQGAMGALGFEFSSLAKLKALTDSVVQSSAIEGEKLNDDAVRSSVARRLGIDKAALLPEDRNVDGVVQMQWDAITHYEQPLDLARLFGWHAALFPTGYSGMHKINVAKLRVDAQGPMQVVSQQGGRERVHFEAPPAEALPAGMVDFLVWFNGDTDEDPILKAGLAHLWFLTLHPFEDGNGRIGRAICDMALAKADQSPERFYSLSAQIQREREDYYTQLEHAQKGTTEVTEWLEWFLGCLLRALKAASAEVDLALRVTRISRQGPSGALNERQVAMLNLMMTTFQGNMTTGKWASLAECSTDTALRDIQELVERGVLERRGESRRGAHYVLAN
jgi:Fic family protein